MRLAGFTRAAWCLTAVTAVLIGAAILDSHRTGVLLKRFWFPMANISATEIHTLSDNTVVARGESLDIAAELSGSPVKDATLILNTEGEDEQTITLVPRGDEQNHLAHRVRSVKAPLRYRLRPVMVNPIGKKLLSRIGPSLPPPLLKSSRPSIPNRIRKNSTSCLVASPPS